MIKQKTPVAPIAWVNEAAIAKAIGMSVYFLQRDRWLHKGKAPGIPYRKVGTAVRYDMNEVMAALDSRQGGVAIA